MERQENTVGDEMLMKHDYEIAQLKEILSKQSENIDKIIVATSKIELMFERITNLDAKREDDNKRVHKRIDACKEDMRTHKSESSDSIKHINDEIKTLTERQNRFIGAVLIMQIVFLPLILNYFGS